MSPREDQELNSATKRDQSSLTPSDPFEDGTFDDQRPMFLYERDEATQEKSGKAGVNRAELIYIKKIAEIKVKDFDDVGETFTLLERLINSRYLRPKRSLKPTRTQYVNKTFNENFDYKKTFYLSDIDYSLIKNVKDFVIGEQTVEIAVNIDDGTNLWEIILKESIDYRGTAILTKLTTERLIDNTPELTTNNVRFGSMPEHMKTTLSTNKTNRVINIKQAVNTAVIWRLDVTVIEQDHNLNDISGYLDFNYFLSAPDGILFILWAHPTQVSEEEVTLLSEWTFFPWYDWVNKDTVNCIQTPGVKVGFGVYSGVDAYNVMSDAWHLFDESIAGRPANYGIENAKIRDRWIDNRIATDVLQSRAYVFVEEVGVTLGDADGYAANYVLYNHSQNEITTMVKVNFTSQVKTLGEKLGGPVGWLVERAQGVASKFTGNGGSNDVKTISNYDIADEQSNYFHGVTCVESEEKVRSALSQLHNDGNKNRGLNGYIDKTKWKAAVSPSKFNIKVDMGTGSSANNVRVNNILIGGTWHKQDLQIFFANQPAPDITIGPNGNVNYKVVEGKHTQIEIGW